MEAKGERHKYQWTQEQPMFQITNSRKEWDHKSKHMHLGHPQTSVPGAFQGEFSSSYVAAFPPENSRNGMSWDSMDNFMNTEIDTQRELLKAFSC